jgi:hypothetical protein
VNFLNVLMTLMFVLILADGLCCALFIYPIGGRV